MRAHGIAPATLGDVADHIEHLARVGGWDHVGIGTDWEGTGGHHPRRLEDVSKIPLLTAELLRRGHSEPEIRKVLGENMLRVLALAQEVELQGG
jgi:membrane dipeptidase